MGISHSPLGSVSPLLNLQVILCLQTVCICIRLALGVQGLASRKGSVNAGCCEFKMNRAGQWQGGRIETAEFSRIQLLPGALSSCSLRIQVTIHISVGKRYTSPRPSHRAQRHLLSSYTIPGQSNSAPPCSVLPGNPPAQNP